MPAVPVRRLPFTLTETSVLAIIPARYQSTRFPGKPLVDLGGKAMVEHVYRRASEATTVTGVIVATDDDRIASAVEAFGGVAWMTRPEHPSGTDRLAEVAAALPAGVVVNVQGDEPLIEPAVIDAAVAPLLQDASVEMSTLCRPLREEEAGNPNVVKVVRALDGRALYFSRANIPHIRTSPDPSGPVRTSPDLSLSWAHVGLYAYRRATLLRLAGLPPTPLERAESLEQLRALEHGIGITVVPTSQISLGVDTPDDVERVRQLLLVHSSRG